MRLTFMNKSHLSFAQCHVSFARVTPPRNPRNLILIFLRCTRADISDIVGESRHMKESISHIPYSVKQRHITRISVCHIFDVLMSNECVTAHINESWHIADMCVTSSGHSALCQGCLDPFLRSTHRPVCPHCREPVARGGMVQSDAVANEDTFVRPLRP